MKSWKTRTIVLPIHVFRLAGALPTRQSAIPDASSRSGEHLVEHQEWLEHDLQEP